MTRDTPEVRRFTDMTTPYFAEAVKRQLPMFVTSVPESNPLNATPYLVPYDLFRATAGAWPGRASLLAALEAARRGAEAIGVAVDAILIGGSFTELSKPKPKDIDCLMFYRLSEEAGNVPVSGLAELQKSSIQNGVDVRFIPLDGDPLVLIKSVSYFTVLYSKQREGSGSATEARLVRALLLVDCGAAAAR